MEYAQGGGVQLEEQLAGGQMDIDGGNELQATDKEARSKEEEERRRKGKGIMIVDTSGPRAGGNEPSPIISGSGSCDPNEVGALHGLDKLASEEGDSKAGPAVKLGEGRDKPIVISEESQEDFDMGGEGEKAGGVEPTKGGTDIKKEEEAREGGRWGVVTAQQGGAQPVARRMGGSQKKQGSAEGSKGSVGSVPPGFTRKPRSLLGAASPFGKMQRGGFKFLKRSAATTSSAPKQGSPVRSKKTRPIGDMQDQEIAEVAVNVGVVDQLSKEHIEHLKSLERDRASS